MASRLSRLDEVETLRGLVRNLREGVYVTDRAGNVLDANPAFLEMLGVSSLGELQSGHVTLVVDPARRAAELEILHRDGAVRDFEIEIRRADGTVRTVIDTATLATDPGTGETYYHGILIDITERKRLEQRLLDQNLRDPLTGCFNRRFLAEFERRHGGPSAPFDGSWGCIMIDLDYFKQYNDEFGHEAGDAVLNRVARFLMRQTRAEESAVRMGGDEFLLLLAGAEASATEFAARRLQSAADGELTVPFSMGWAAREEGETLEKTIARADRRMLKARGDSRSAERPKLVLPA